MTRQDTRRRFPTASDGLASPPLAGCLEEGGSNGDDGTDSDDGHAYPAAKDVVQVTVPPG
jgi:hypothetical protein